MKTSELNMNNNKLQGHCAIFMANVIFGLGVPVTKMLLDNWMTPMGYMAARSLGAAVIFWFIACFLPKEKVNRHDLMTILLCGLLGFVVSQTLTAWALDYTTPVYYSLIAALTPIAVMLMAALFIKEHITSYGILGVVLGIGGAMLMLLTSWQGGGNGQNDLLGIVLTMMSLLTWAIYLIATRKVSQKYSPVTQMKWIFLVSTVVTVPWAMITEPTQPLFSQAWGWSGIAEMFFIIVFATVLGYFMIPYAMKHLQATTVSIYTNLQPVVASIIAIVIGQDILTWDKPVAAIMVLVGARLVSK